MAKIINVPVDYVQGDVVFLITDPEQLKRIITGILLKPGKLVMYELSCCEDISYHYSFEITNEKDILQQYE